MRTCVGCRQRAGTGSLVRVARRADGSLVISRVAPGRGAWLCRDPRSDAPRPSCVQAADRRGGFIRALRAPVADGAATRLLDQAGHANMEQDEIPTTRAPRRD